MTHYHSLDLAQILAHVGPAAETLARARGYRQSEPRPRGHRLIVDGRDVSPSVQGFRIDRSYDGRVEVTVTLRGADPAWLQRVEGEGVEFWDGGRNHSLYLVGYEFEARQGALNEVTLKLEGWR